MCSVVAIRIKKEIRVAASEKMTTFKLNLRNLFVLAQIFSHPHICLVSFHRFIFDVNVSVKGKTGSSHQATRSEETPWRSESAPFIFPLFVVTVTVTHPESYRTPLLFLLTPWIMQCCHSWLALNHLPLVFYFEGGFIGFLSRLCVENDLELEPTSAVKIKIDMTSMGLTWDKWLFL